MKCYHLIYNSSERSIKGAPGFGIHTYSEDLPKDVLAAIEKDPELFAFQYKGVQLTPNTLNNNPDSITPGINFIFFSNSSSSKLSNFVSNITF